MPSLYPYSYGDTLLTLENVSLFASEDRRLLTKPEPKARPILNDINAAVKKIIRPGQVQGQMIGICGPSGRGKTQLFRIIAGLNPPTAGRVLLHGGKPVEVGQVGVVAQSYPLLPHRTILSNLLLAAQRKEKDAPSAHAQVMGYLQTFKLEDKAFAYPAQLSGGQRQRCAIIQQILCSDHFLLMDEPFSGLDIVMEDQALQSILKVANLDDLNTVIVVSHDVSALASIVDHLWLLGHRPDDPEGRMGSTIVKTYDLIEEGLCWEQWQPNAMVKPALAEFIRQVKEDFIHL